MPYSRSAKEAAEAVDLTSQTVMNSIRELGSVSNDAVEEVKQDKKAVNVLYIEADEDHVPLQVGGYAGQSLYMCMRAGNRLVKTGGS